MKHIMKLYADAFEQMKSGKKTREYKINDEKRRRLSVGDTIEFFKIPGQVESITVIVKGLRQYDDWYSCYGEFFNEDLSDYYSSIEEAINDTYENWWTKEKEQKYGCLVIEIGSVKVSGTGII